MKLKTIRMDKEQNDRGAFSDKGPGPKVMQMTVQDEETGQKYYCAYLKIEEMEDFTVTKRNVLHAIANDYIEDVIPWRLESYTSTRNTWASLPDSEFYGIYQELKEKYAQDKSQLDVGTVHSFEI